jgi:hypothetical protein
VLGQDPVGAAVRVQASVVECDQDRPLRQVRGHALQEADVLRDRDGLETGAVQHRHLLGKLTAGDRVVVALSVHAVVGKHGHCVADRWQRLPARQLRLAGLERGCREGHAIRFGDADLGADLGDREVQRDQRQRQQQERDRTTEPVGDERHRAASGAGARVPQLELRDVRIAYQVCHSRNAR